MNTVCLMGSLTSLYLITPIEDYTTAELLKELLRRETE